MNTRLWLEKLVAFDTTSRNSNLALIETVRDALAHQGMQVELIHSPEGDKANLFATLPASDGLVVESNTPDIQHDRQRLTQMLFVEGNHHCPFCEKSGMCHLQAVAYHLNMQDTHFVHAYPHHEVDASHPDVWLDRSRCILCELCVRASREVDGNAPPFGLRSTCR